MLRICCSKHLSAEKEYIFDILFTEILALNFGFTVNTEVTHYELRLPNGSLLIIKNHFLSDTNSTKYEAPKSVQFIKNNFSHEEDIPLLYGKNTFQVSKDKIICGIDIFATCFFMLTRFEEIQRPNRDKHNRFPATASLAFKYDFLERPIVDEYVEMLWSMLNHLDPSLKRKSTAGRVLVSCDVDEPFDASVSSISTLVRVMVGDIIKRKSPLEAMKRLNRYVCNQFGYYQFDPKYTFDWYMDVCEKYGHQAAFYFIADNSEPNNGCYSIFEKRIQALMLKIHERGHEIGMHGSYQSFDKEEKLIDEQKKLEKSLEQIGIEQKVKGNRQHYLRWDVAVTPEYLDTAGFEYDTTGAYADRPGFRFGTSHEFSMWGWKQRKKLRLKQRPLIVMECSVISDAYLALGYSNEALQKIMTLRDRSLKYGGNFSMLWHNSHLMTERDKCFFEAVVKVD